MKKNICLIILLISFYQGYSQILGVTQPTDNINSLSLQTGGYELNQLSLPDRSFGWIHLWTLRHSNASNNYQMQMASTYANNDRLFFRKIAQGDLSDGTATWNEIATRSANVYEGNQKIFAKTESWAEGISVIKATGWSGIRFARNDPSSGNFEGNWALGYNGFTGNDFSISNNHNNVQNDYIFHISASSRNIGIGTSTPTEKLSVNGKIRAKEIKVETVNWPDYVFNKNYKLPTLEETENHIKEKGHLPGVPSAKEVEENGISLGEMNAMLLKKIEELTLHVIEQSKQLNEQKQLLKKQQELLEAKFPN